MGVGTSAPASKLSVKGAVSVGSTYATGAAPTAGAIIEGSVGIGNEYSRSCSDCRWSPLYSRYIQKQNQSTADHRAGGGFSSLGSSTAANRYARLFLDADGANFAGTGLFHY